LLRVSAIIPHAGGWDILLKCLTSLYRSRDVEFEAIIVENGSFERIEEEQVRRFPGLRILRFERRLGFAGACNRGAEAAAGKHLFLLNNDAEVEPDTIYILSEALESDNKLAACQPKILSLRNPGRFDYSSACGGEIDVYGFPFARGRLFETIEDDVGQYDDCSEIFWGAGAALMIRRDIFLGSGGLEEPFFAHMEEIDLQWRFHLMGFSVKVVPQAVAHHLGAATIGYDSAAKLYLNHRNNLAMLARNYGFRSLARYFPVRLLFDLAVMIGSVFRLELKRSLAVLRAWGWFWLSLPYLIRGRFRVQRLRRVNDRELSRKIYRRSIVWQYFIRKRRTFSELIKAVK